MQCSVTDAEGAKADRVDCAIATQRHTGLACLYKLEQHVQVRRILVRQYEPENVRVVL